MYDEINSVFLHGGMSSEAEVQKDYFQKGLIYTVQIELTMKCAQGCVYCYVDSRPDSSEGLPSTEIKRILDDAAEINVRCIDWLGGDPLLRPDWYEIMLYAQKIGLINNIWTSGLPLQNKIIAKRVVEVTKNRGFVSVHLDSLNPEVYKKVHLFRAHENIEKILKGVDNILSLGKASNEIWNCITLTKPVAESDVYETMEWFWKNKRIRTVLTLYNPVINLYQNKELEPDHKMIQRAYQGRDKILYDDRNYSFSTMDVNKFYCGSMICITNEGYYTPCSVIRTEQFGSYKTMDLKTLLKENPGDILMIKLRDPKYLPEPCSSCEQNEICFGCRSSAFYYDGDMFGCDPKCSKCQNNIKNTNFTNISNL